MFWPEAMPQFFRDERQNGMLQPQVGAEDGEKISPVVGEAGVRRQTKLLDFEIPVAKIVPEELPQLLGHFVITMLFERAIHRIRRCGSGG